MCFVACLMRIGIPNVRSLATIDACRQEFVADNAVDHGLNVALRQAAEMGIARCDEFGASFAWARQAWWCRDLLAPIYGWFTEGFDTRDLKESKALLDALASWASSKMVATYVMLTILRTRVGRKNACAVGAR
jgi:predicted ATPase